MMKPVLSALFLVVHFLLDTHSSKADNENSYGIDLFYQSRTKRHTLNVAEKQKVDTSIMLNVQSPWENFLVPIPTVVALLGQLMVVSTRQDFSFVELNPNISYRFIRQPTSFQATLVQIANDGWDTFHTAQRNMAIIQAYMESVPAYIHFAQRTIKNASPRLIKRLLPPTLKKIQTANQNCITAALETESEFVNVMQLLGEVLESTVASKGASEDTYRQAQLELSISKQRESLLQNYTEMLKKRQEEIEEKVIIYRDAYKKAIDEIPTGWEAIAQEYFRIIPRLINNLASFGIATIATSEPSSSQGDVVINLGGSDRDPKISHLITIMQEVSEIILKMKVAVNETFYGISDRNDSVEQFNSFNVTLRRFNAMLRNLCAFNEISEAESLIQNATDICERIIGWYQTSSSIMDEDRDAVLTELRVLFDHVKLYVAASAYKSAGMSIQQGEISQLMAFSGIIDEGNERFKAYMNLQLLQEAEKRSDDIFAQVLDNQRKMMELIEKMTQLNITQLNLEKIIDLLNEGIIILSTIREQWSKLVEFFSLVAVRVEVTLTQTLGPFIIVADSAVNLENLSDEERHYLTETLSMQTSEIYRVTSFLHTLSSTYVNISSMHLDRLAGLGRMLTATNDADRQDKLKQLELYSKESQGEIEQMVQEKRRNFKSLVQRRIREERSYIDSLGGPTKEELEADLKGRKLVEGQQA